MPKNSTHSQHRDIPDKAWDFRAGDKMVCFIYQSIRLDVLNRMVYDNTIKLKIKVLMVVSSKEHAIKWNQKSKDLS